MAAADSGLISLMDEYDIPEATQQVVYHYGFTHIKKFGRMDRDEEGLRKMLASMC